MMNWQQLIGKVYEYWQNNPVTYGEALQYANEQFGDLGELAILLKNYNYQVCNGGHLQYFDNGYCDDNGGCFAKRDYDIPFHKRMVALFEQFNLHLSCPEYYKVMASFEVIYEEGYTEECEEECYSCNGNGKDCYDCDGSGVIFDEYYVEEEIYIDGRLNSMHYRHSDAFIEFFDGFIKKTIQ